MKWTKKKIVILIAIIVAIALLIWGICTIDIKKVNEDNTIQEIIPEEEISDQQLRETTITLYYVDSNNEIISEIRKIDSKNLLEDPYYELLNLLIEGPKADDVRSCIPENTKINNISKNGDMIIIDFSKEFIENQLNDGEEESLAIRQIVNTLTQFIEVNYVKIVIDGQENCVSKTGTINYQQIFTNED